MIQRIPYTFEKKKINTQYIEFELSFTGVDTIAFSFFYRKKGFGKWIADADVVCTQPCFVSGNVLSNVQLVAGKCQIRWNYPQNCIDYNESVDIEIRPEAIVRNFSFNGDKSYVSDFEVYGLSNVQILSEKRFLEDVYVLDDGIYFNNTLIFSGLSSVKSVDRYYALGKYRFVICDSGNGRIVDVSENGTLMNSVSGISVVYSQYNTETFNVLYTDPLNKDVIEILWNESDGSASALSGGVVWNYNSDFSTYPLMNPTSATFGLNNRLVVVDEMPILVDRDRLSLQKIEYFKYKRNKGYDVDNRYVPSSVSSAYEIDDGRVVVFESSGAELPYLSESLHPTYNRSLSNDSAFSLHSSFYNDLFCPIKPVLSDETNVTISLLNSGELKKSVDDAYKADGQKQPVLGNLTENMARGNVINDNPFWGIGEGYNKEKGLQTFACLTGQQLNFSVPFNNKKVGFAKTSSGVSPVYVSEKLSVDVVNTLSGVSETLFETLDFNSSSSFSFVVPNASSESYQTQKNFGFHGYYLIKISVTESYFSNNQFDSEILNSKSYVYYISLVSFWWRQIFKEISISGSPVSSDFVLENYSETPEDFFQNYTVYPSFYRVVGSTTITPPNAQKRKILYENALALFTFYSSILPGNAYSASIFGFNPGVYRSQESPIMSNVSRNNLTPMSVENSLSGMDAYSFSTNVFQDDPGETSLNTQKITDSFGVIFSEYDSFSKIYGQNGFVLQPFVSTCTSAQIFSPNERKRLSLVIDRPDLTVDSITVSGHIGDTHVRPGDTIIKVAFTTSSSPVEVTISLSVNNGPYSTYTDPSGLARDFTFTISEVIAADSIVNAMIELVSSDGVRYAYYSTQKSYSATRVTSINNVQLSLDKTGKRLLIKYDFHAKYDFLPYDVIVSMGTSTLSDITAKCQGDVDNIFSGNSKAIIFNYGQEVEAEDQLVRQKIRLTFKSIDSKESSYNYDFTVSFKTSDIWTNNIAEESVVFVEKEITPLNSNPIVSTDHVYSINSFLYGTLVYSASPIPFNISSSSCSSSSSSSLSLSSSSISLSSFSLSSSSSSLSCSSSSCSSSSAD
jgi:hypothetical protein